MSKICIEGLLLFCLFIHFLYADSIGSTTISSVQGSYTFPQNPLLTANQIVGFAWMQNGFTLQNSSTQCTFSAAFPVSGTVNLNGGTLILNQNLYFADTVNLQGLGVIEGNGYSLHLCPTITQLPSNTASFQNINIFCESNLSLLSAITFTGSCMIFGKGNTISLQNNAKIIVDTNASLTLHNMQIQGIEYANISCKDNSGTLILDNVTWVQTDTFGWSYGALTILDEVVFSGDNTVFSYQSTQTLTIQQRSSLVINSFINFNYAASSPYAIYMIDETSKLILEGCTLIATSGFVLTNGTIYLKATSYLQDQSTVGITIGNGIAGNDCVVVIDCGPRLEIIKGTLNYKNINNSSWQMAGSSAILHVNAGTRLNLFQNMVLGNGIVIFENNTVLGRKQGMEIIGSTHVLGNLILTII